MKRVADLVYRVYGADEEDEGALREWSKRSLSMGLAGLDWLLRTKFRIDRGEDTLKPWVFPASSREEGREESKAEG